MDKKHLIHSIEWLIAVAACGWLIWKMASYDDYDSLWASLREMAAPQWTALLLALLLMPLNMAVEAWKWQKLLNGQSDKVQSTKGISFTEAQRQVYYSKLAGLITPWRLGEYPARGVLEVQRDNVQSTKDVVAKVLSMGVVGSATMTAAIVIAGVVGLAFSPAVFSYLGGSYLYSLAFVIVLLGVGYALMPRALRKYAEVNQSILLVTTAQSLLRLACWCLQLALVLWALGAFQLSTFNFLPIYYLLVTLTPNVPIVEVGVRGAWAIFLFGTMNAALAGVLLWAINTLLPCLIWPFLRKKY